MDPKIVIPWLAVMVAIAGLWMKERRDNRTERERQRAAKRANVVATYFRDANGGRFPHRLRIANTGPGQATAVAVSVNGEPLATTGHVLRKGEPITVIAGGAHQDYTLYVTGMGPPPTYKIDVEWQDASGIAGKSHAEFQV